MSAELFHVFIIPNPGISMTEVEKKLNLAKDWFRYSDGAYLLFTTTGIDTWAERLKPLTNQGGNLLILDIDPHQYKGWMPKTIWPWLEEKKRIMYPHG